MNQSYKNLTKAELVTERDKVTTIYKEYQDMNLGLDMSRGKPSTEQLDLSLPMMDILNSSSDYKSCIDCRNYGVADGIPEAKQLMAEMLEVKTEQVIVCGNSSLNIMFDLVGKAMIKGIMGNTPWSRLGNVKFLCPAPGYDRHFGIMEYFGIEMITIPMKQDGPDMDLIEQYVNNDESVKGIWCVPKYANPLGITYTDEVVKRFAKLTPAAKDFRIFWDNAYCVHHLYENEQDVLLNILDECQKENHPDMVYMLGSTSKVTFSGAGISAVASSVDNVKDILSQIQWQTIGYDKVNQLRHARYFKNKEGLDSHMLKHAELIRPKFEMVIEILERELGGTGIGSWTQPKGGYFISFDSMPGCAKDIVQKAKEAGVVMTGAGATFPYGKDPQDSNIRIAPTFPSVEELKLATELFVICVKLVTLDHMIQA